MTTTNFKVKVIIERDTEGFHAYSPSLKGLHVWGETIPEVKTLAADAVKAYLSALIKNGDEIPIGTEIKSKKRFLRPFRSIIIYKVTVAKENYDVFASV